MRDMTLADRMRLKAHARSHRLFQKLLEGTADGKAPLVATLSPTEWKSLRTLLELGYVDVEDGRCIVTFTVSSLIRLGYVG